MGDAIGLVVDGAVATITLNRPDRLNAFTGEMADDLIAAFDRTDADPRVRAVIVTGAGRAFCAGADLEGGGATFAGEGDAPDWDDEANRDIGGRVALRIFASLKPVIAAINGPAVGIGATMTLPMDARLVGEQARIGFVFARRGIVPEAASSWFLPRLVGIAHALDWCLTGRLLSAGEVVAGGLARSAHAADELLPAARALAQAMAEVSPVSAAVTRQMLWRGLTEAHPMAAHRVDSRMIRLLGAGPDAREGVDSFLEKRPPDWPGRVPGDLPADWPPWRDPPWRVE